MLVRHRSPASSQVRSAAPVRVALLLAACLSVGARVADGQPPPGRSTPPEPRPAAPAPDSVRAIPAPRMPLPSEAASAGVTRFSFLAYGDTRGRFDGERLQDGHGLVVASMLRTIAARANGPDPVRFIVSSGDAVVDGRNAQQWNVSFVDLVAQLTTRGNVPVLPAPGNHDVAHTSDLASPDRRQGLGHYFAAFRNLIPPEGTPRRLSGYSTYAVGYGNVFVLAMDSNIADDPTQYAWVRAQLAGIDRRRYRHIAVVLHHPAFSSGPHGAAILEPQAAVMRTRYFPLFRQYHVDLVLAGHEHLFEHWVERYQDASGRPYRLDQFVSGGGGAPPYPYRGEPDLRAYLTAGAAEHVTVEHLVRPSMNAWENPYHYLVVHVDGDRVRVEVIGVDAGADFQPYRSRTVDLDATSVGAADGIAGGAR